MMPKLSPNELEMLGRQVAALSHQVSEIAASLDSRLGETHELAISARNAEKVFAGLAQRVRRQLTAAGEEEPESRAQSA